VKSYFERCGATTEVPSWYPRRPYLVATLARRGILLGRKADGSVETDPGYGWNSVLDALAAREAKIDPKLDGAAVRQILERVASLARSTNDGLGPITPSDLAAVFHNVCGYEPDAQGEQILVRLPGLGIYRAGEDSRVFVDDDFADACRAGDVCRYITAPWNKSYWTTPVRAMGPIGQDVADAALEDSVADGVFSEAATRAPHAVALDIVQLALHRGRSVTAPPVIRDINCDLVALDSGGRLNTNLTFQDCYFRRLEIDGFPEGEGVVRFQSCYITDLFGPIGHHDLPPDTLDGDCAVERWSSQLTSNASAVGATHDVRIGVLITMLRKLFFQSGSGRREDALFRGLNTDEQRYVGPILKLLERAGFVSTFKRRGSNVWNPNRSLLPRASAIVQSPSVCGDKMLDDVRAL
jgi:hypothetical protein